MLPVSKHFDPVIGVDMHMVTMPFSPTPVPMPHPFVGFVLDPIDYVPFLGTQVHINGLKRGNAETAITLASNVHAPMGMGFHPAFMPHIHNDGINFYGSNTVNADGSYLSGTGHMVMTCSCLGLPLGGYLPTSNSIPMPMGNPVFVGGTQVPNLNSLSYDVALANGLKFLKKLAKKPLKKVKSYLKGDIAHNRVNVLEKNITKQLEKNKNSQTTQPEIIEAYWIDENNKKCTKLKFEKKVGIFIKTKNAIGKKINIKVKDNDWGYLGNDDSIYETSFILNSDEVYKSFDFTRDMFCKGLDSIDSESAIDLYFELKIDEITKVFCDNKNEYLKVHYIRYIPEIMDENEWKIGAKLQREWFGREASDEPQKNKPVLDIVTMKWVLGFESIKKTYDTIIAEKKWVNNAAKGVIVENINLMHKDGLIKYPKNEGDKVKFGGITSQEIIDYKGEKMPKFHKYYSQYVALDEYYYYGYYYDNINRPLDDLLASLGKFTFRIIVEGSITRQKNKYLIEITKIYTYVYDSFDFNDKKYIKWVYTQPLGFWNIKTGEVSKLPNPINKFKKYIGNSDYRDYRKVIDEGGDYKVYSDLKSESTYDTFEIPIADLDI